VTVGARFRASEADPEKLSPSHGDPGHERCLHGEIAGATGRIRRKRPMFLFRRPSIHSRAAGNRLASDEVDAAEADGSNEGGKAQNPGASNGVPGQSTRGGTVHDASSGSVVSVSAIAGALPALILRIT
jgi:hypothetical protein